MYLNYTKDSHTDNRTASKPLTPAERAFEDIWLAYGSVGYLRGPYTTESGKVNWSTAKRVYDGKDYLFKFTSKDLWHEWRDPNRCIGKRFGKSTNYVVLDIDRPGAYHHLNDGGTAIKGIIGALEDIGLVQPVSVSSSGSDGLHIYFPLPKLVPSWVAAGLLKQTLEAAGFEIKGGQLETFPNVKSDHWSQYYGHRLPLQRGSYLLDETLYPFSSDMELFVQCWKFAANRQDFDTFSEALETFEFGVKPEKTHRGGFNLTDKLQWTGAGQSNENWGAVVAYLVEVEGLKDPIAIERRAWEWALSHGYSEHASYAEKRDKNHLKRWIKSRLTKGERKFTLKGAGNLNPNQARVDECTDRLKIILSHLDTAFTSANQLFQWVCSKCKDAFGIGISKKSFLSRKSFWEHLLNDSVEATAPSLEGQPLAPTSEIGRGTQLNGNCSNQFGTQGFEVVPAPSSEPESDIELATQQVAPDRISDLQFEVCFGDSVNKPEPVFKRGDWVRCLDDGSALDYIGKVYKITSKRNEHGFTFYTLNGKLGRYALAMLPQHLQPVTDRPTAVDRVKATSDQLQRVLGQLNPFSGDREWEVTPADIGRRQFNRLLELVGGAV
ncbi:hypothetical protein ACQ4N7_28935 [Nodosilinea sp. AN01ver1]|uniref:hypothetical protein n=1 Tax=Nodosilinea sp. AN01ver1 TaxID=3423362 RepID=UPI003D31C7FF